MKMVCNVGGHFIQVVINRGLTLPDPSEPVFETKVEPVYKDHPRRQEKWSMWAGDALILVAFNTR